MVGVHTNRGDMTLPGYGVGTFAAWSIDVGFERRVDILSAESAQPVALANSWNCHSSSDTGG